MNGVVLFDLDGTLTDSAPGIAAGINATLGTSHAVEEIRPFIGPPLQQTFATLTGETDPATIDALVARYRATYAELMVEGSTVYDGIPEVLAGLQARGVLLGVATSKARHLAVDLLKGLGLARHFAAIEGPVPPSHDDKHATIGKALVALQHPPVRTVTMVGDRHHDVDGAQARGIRAVGVLWGFGDHDELKHADALAAAPADLLDVLLSAR